MTAAGPASEERIEGAEQPARADDRSQGREKEPEQADIAPQLSRRALGSSRQWLREFGRRLTPFQCGRPEIYSGWPRDHGPSPRVSRNL